MQKIFKIERLNKASGFKNTPNIENKRKRKCRDARKRKVTAQGKEIEQLIALQAKLQNEEKEQLIKQEQTIVNGRPEEDQTTEESSEFIHNSRLTVTSIDAAILEGLDFIESAPMIKEARELFLKEKVVLLPEKSQNDHEYTLVLDLDETLVHCGITPFEGFDEISVVNSDEKITIYISYRPYLIEFLEKMSQQFEVVVFTASEKEYANMVLDRIDPEKKYIKHRLFRDAWLPLNGNYIKDLSILGRDINKTLIIDNSIIAFSLNIDNGIPIQSFVGNKQDIELYKLVEVLNSITRSGMALHPDGFNYKEYLTSMFGLKERIYFWQSQWILQAQNNIKVNSS